MIQSTTYLEVTLQDVPELLALSISRILNLQIPTLGHNLFSGKRTLGVAPSRVLPPGLDVVDLLQVLLVFVFEAHCDGLVV